MSSITTSALDTPTRRSLERTCDDLAILVLAVLAITAGLTFRDYALERDDSNHAHYADLLLPMYGAGFSAGWPWSTRSLVSYRCCSRSSARKAPAKRRAVSPMCSTS